MTANKYVTTVVTDAWEGLSDQGKEIQNPDLNDLEMAIQRLDGQKHTLVILGTPSQAHMAVGGGAGRYVIYATVDNIIFWNLLSTDAHDGILSLHVGGQDGDYPANQVNSKEAALKAARTFFERGELDPALSWKKG